MADLEQLFSSIVPALLALLMLGMGLSLTLQDFARLARTPRPVVLGVSAQLVGLPLLAFALGWSLGVPKELAAGAMLLAACPGGVTSNGYVLVARGDVSLSVTLTAISSVATIVTIPLVTAFALAFFLDQRDTASLPVGTTINQLVRVTLVPIACGMFVRQRWPRVAEAAREPARRLSLLVLVAIVVGVTVGTLDALVESFAHAAGLALALNAIGLASGYGLGRAARLSQEQCRTLTFEVGVQNLSLAVLVAVSILDRPELASFSVVYALIMKVTALTLLWWWRSSAPSGA